MRKLTRSWWRTDKPNYIFEPRWIDAFKPTVPELQALSAYDKLPVGKLGVVFWHENDGNTITPVGITYRDGNQFLFQYHPDYVNSPDTQAISVALPKRTKPYRYNSSTALLPFFDNLVSEGWLGMTQCNAIHELDNNDRRYSDVADFEGIDNGEERYRRLLTFGRGFHGAIAVVDMAMSDQTLKWEEDQASKSLLSGATVGGVQPKMLAVGEPLSDGSSYAQIIRPAKREEASQYIVKFPQRYFPNIVQNEFLNILATQVLLPLDTTAHVDIHPIKDEKDGALVIRRFDRNSVGGRIHFEEALQVMGYPASAKYSLDYSDLAAVTQKLTGDEGVKTVFKRILAQIILGNADGHLKNFAFWQKDGHWELAPNYDLVSTDVYKRKMLPLTLGGKEYTLHDMTPKRIVLLGRCFGFDLDQVKTMVHEMLDRVEIAKSIVRDGGWLRKAAEISEEQRQDFCTRLDGRVRHALSGFDRYYQICKSRGDGQSRSM